MNILNLLKNDKICYLLTSMTRELLIRKVKEINLLETLPYEILITEILPNIDALDLFNLCQKSKYLSKLCQDQQALENVKYNKSIKVYIEQGLTFAVEYIYNKILKDKKYHGTIDSISIYYINDILSYAEEITQGLKDIILRILSNITSVNDVSKEILQNVLTLAIIKNVDEIIKHILDLKIVILSNLNILSNITYLAFALEKIEIVKIILSKIGFLLTPLSEKLKNEILQLTTTEAIINKLLETNSDLIFNILLKVIQYKNRNIIDYLLSKLTSNTYLKVSYFEEMIKIIEIYPDIDITPKVILKYEELMAAYIQEDLDELIMYDFLIRLANIVRDFSISQPEIFIELIPFLKRRGGFYPKLKENYIENYIKSKLSINRDLLKFLIKYFPDDFLILAVEYFDDELLKELYSYDFQPSKEAYEKIIERLVLFGHLEMLKDILNLLPADYKIITEEFIIKMKVKDPYFDEEEIEFLESYL